MADKDNPEEGLSMKFKKGSFIDDPEPSVTKLNFEREGKLNFAAKTNILLAVILLVSASSAVWKATRPHMPSPVYIQYLSQAGIMVPIETVPLAGLPPPRTTPAPAPAPAPAEAAAAQPPQAASSDAAVAPASAGAGAQPITPDHRHTGTSNEHD